MQAVILLSCVKEELGPERACEVVFSGMLATDKPQTKTIFDFNGATNSHIFMQWESTDSIGIFGSYDSQPTCSNLLYTALPEEDDARRSQFIFADRQQQRPSYIPYSRYMAYSPYSATQTDPTCIECSVPKVQIFGDGNNRSKSFLVSRPQWATSSDVNLAFTNIFSTLTLGLKGSRTVYSLLLTPAESDEQIVLRGDYALNLTNPYSTPTLKSGTGGNSIRVRFPGGLQLTSQEVRVPIGVAPFTIPEGGMRLTFDLGDETLSRVIWKNKTQQQRAVLATANTHLYQPLKAIGSEWEDAEREALTIFYNSTSGAQWAHNDNWLSDAPLDEWYGISLDSQGHVKAIELSFNNLSGAIPAEMVNLGRLDKLDLSGNSLTGNLPEGMGHMPLSSGLNISFNFMEGNLPEDVWEHPNAGEFVFGPQYNGNQIFSDIESVDKQNIHANGSMELYCEANLNSGLRPYYIYVAIDGFTAEDFAIGGNAQTAIYTALDAIFDQEPFKSMKNYFTVYIVYSHSPNRGIGFGSYSVQNNYGTKQDQTASTIMSLTGTGRNELINDLTVATQNMPIGRTILLIANSVVYAGTTWSYLDGTQLCILPSFRELGKVACHELGGHGIGHLADEYVNSITASAFPISYAQTMYSSDGWFANVDFTDNRSSIKWRQMLSDSRYNGLVGVYEGGYYRSSGVWRPSAESIMNNNTGGFNAPSRMAIYTFIRKNALKAFTFRYELFVESDAAARAEESTRGAIGRPWPEHLSPLGPPIMVDSDFLQTK